MTRSYHLNNITLILLLILMVELFKLYMKSSSLKEYISSLKESVILHSIFDVTARIFLVFTTGYIVICHLFYEYETLHLSSIAKQNIDNIFIDIVNFNFETIGLRQDWSMPSQSQTGLDSEKYAMIKDQIDKAFTEKLLVCKYANNSILIFWYDPSILGKIGEPYGDYYRKYWDKHPLQKIEGRTNTCPQYTSKG